MNWIKENKFLTGYLAVLAAAAGVLIFLVFDAKGKFDDAQSAYNQQADELNRLEKLPLYPNAINLRKREDQKQDHQIRINELEAKLLQYQIPVEPITPEAFQDKLRASATEFAQHANDAGMKLPEKFFMGFERYQTEPPKPAAAPLLYRELRAMELVLNDLPAHSVVELKSITREQLPEETGAMHAETAAPSRPGQAAAGGAHADKAAAQVAKHPFEIIFLAPKGAFQIILNDVATNKTQFMIPRQIIAHNEKDKGPTRDEAGQASTPPSGAAAAPAQAQPAHPAAAPAISKPADTTPTFIVGEERVEVTMRVEVVDFQNSKASPPAPKPVKAS